MSSQKHNNEKHEQILRELEEQFGPLFKQSFLNDFVANEDRQMYARNYQHHVAGLRHPITFRFHGLRKDGSTFAAETDMIPLCWRGHAVAYHFVREIS
jgi:hypothetical protein